MDQWLDFSDFIDKTQELIDFGLYDEARVLLDKYEHSFPDEWEYYFLYSRLYAEQNRPEEAIPCLHEGLRLDGENVDCLVGLFYAYSMINKMREAGEYLLQAEKHHPDHELVLSALVWYNMEKNDLHSAIACFERVRAQGIANPETFRNAGLAYDRLGRYDSAAECFRAALELYPGYDEACELLSDLYIANGQPEKAVELYEQALAKSPNNIRHLSRLTFCRSQNNEHEKAIATAEESIRLYPNSPVGHIDLAYVYLNSGMLDKAMAAADKALDVSPLDAEGHRAKALVLSEQGDDIEAEQYFEKALSFDNDNSEILRDYYHHLRQTRAFTKMEEIVSRAIKTGDPSCVEDYWFLADYHREKKEYRKAIEYLSKAYKIRPGEHDILALVADVLIARGHRTFALSFMKRYVGNAGWNESMDQIAACPQLRNSRIQEGLRFLRFCGSSSTEFHRFIFAQGTRRAVTIAFFAIAVVAAFPILLFFGTKGIVLLAASALLLPGAAHLLAALRQRSARLVLAQSVPLP
jgi:tetratricopeptide (TPR) repeat protein